MILSHTPVMLNEVIQSLITNKSGYYIDGTIGGGGHLKEILKKLILMDEYSDLIETLMPSSELKKLMKRTQDFSLYILILAIYQIN